MVISKEEFQKYNNDIGRAFIQLQTRIKGLLQRANCDDLKNACIAQMHNPGGAEISKELIGKISQAESSDTLFNLLVCSPYWSWLDIRILEVMVTASEIEQAHQLLKNYKTVFFCKRLVDLVSSAPSKKVNEEYYTKVVTKMEKDSNIITISDLLIFQSQLEGVIMDSKKGICILDCLKEGCVEIHWYIPTICVDRVYWTARAKCYQFNDFHLQYLIIGHHPVIQKLIGEFEDISVLSPLLKFGMYIEMEQYNYFGIV